jgi:hypothetical protein
MNMSEEKLQAILDKLDVIISILKKEMVVEKTITKTGKLGKVKHKISDKPCRTCGKLISWDGYDKDSRPYPLHVDEDGYEIEGCYKK